MWWSAVRWKGKLLFPQLPKLLSSSDFLSVVDRGETSALDQQHEMFHTLLFCSSEGQRVIYFFFYSSLRSLLVRRWSWRSKGSSCLSLGRKTVKTAAKTTCQSMKRSESVLVYLKNHINFHNYADMSMLLVRLFLRLCGDKPVGTMTETSNDNKMTVVFRSDGSYVDRGFDAVFEAIDVKDREFP